jgi:hypothetical protein
MGGVVPIFRCGRCGAPGAPVDVVHEGERLLTVHACRPCLAEVKLELARVRPVYEAMLEVGLSRAFADDLMGLVVAKLFPDDE